MQEEGYTEQYFIYHCGFTFYYYLWLGIVISFKMVIHVCGFVVAILIWKVDIDPLNDAKFTIVIIYLATVAMTVFLILSVFTDLYINIYVFVWQTFVAGVCFTILALVFVPKVT